MNNILRWGVLCLSLTVNKVLQQLGPYNFFDEVGGEGWISERRAPIVGPIDIESSADLLGIPVHYDENLQFKGVISNLDKDDRLLISLRPGGHDLTTTFGHEIGHAFLELVAEVKLPIITDADIIAARMTDVEAEKLQQKHRIEHFCDVFGANYALPFKEIDAFNEFDEQTVLDGMKKYGVGLSDILLQFMRAGLIDEKLIIRSRLKKIESTYPDKMITSVLCLCCVTQSKSCTSIKPSMMLDLSDHEYGGAHQTCRVDGYDIEEL